MAARRRARAQQQHAQELSTPPNPLDSPRQSTKQEQENVGRMMNQRLDENGSAEDKAIENSSNGNKTTRVLAQQELPAPAVQSAPPTPQADAIMHDWDDDVLDAEARYPNWLTGLPFSSAYKELARIWAPLPMYQEKDKLRAIVRLLRTTSVSVIISGTGSGKTVIVPKLALKYAVDKETEEIVDRVMMASNAAAGLPDDGINASRKQDQSDATVAKNNTGNEQQQQQSQPFLTPKSASAADATLHGNKVVITNPKSGITQDNATFMAKMLDVEVGHEVGYAFRGSPPYAHNPKRERLFFTTDGYLVALSRKDPTFSEYAVVIIDEAHERTVYIDTLLYMLRRAVQLRPELRVVIISATIDPAEFTSYFSRAGVSTGDVYVSGINYPVEDVFISGSGDKHHHDKDRDRDKDYIRGPGVTAVGMALTRTAPGQNILFFVPTVRDAERGCREIGDACAKGRLPKPGCTRMQCSALYAKLSKERQAEARSQVVPLPYDRKIIFATNIAESSLTLKSLSSVIDSGLELDSAWLPEYHCTRMQRMLSSQAQMNQRKGRVGRVRPGTCYHLYTPQQMAQQPLYPAPAVLTVDLTDDVLTSTRDDGNLSVACAAFAEFLTPPTPNQIAAAVSVLAFYRMVVVRAMPTAAAGAMPPATGQGFGDIDLGIVEDVYRRLVFDAKRRIGVVVESGGLGGRAVAASAPRSVTMAAAASSANEKGSKKKGKHRGDDGGEPGRLEQQRPQQQPTPRAASAVPRDRADDTDYVAARPSRSAKQQQQQQYDLQGEVTPLGRATLDVMRRCKLGLWNALLVVAGVLFGAVRNDMTTTANMVALAAILEETAGDPTLLWYDESKAHIVLRNCRLHPTSEHASLLSVFEEITGPRREKYVREDAVSDGVLQKILRRVHEQGHAVRSLLKSKEFLTSLGDRDRPPLAVSLDAEASLSAFDRCVIWARLYHCAVPSTTKTDSPRDAVVPFHTLFTPQPLRVKEPAGPRAALLSPRRSAAVPKPELKPKVAPSATSSSSSTASSPSSGGAARKTSAAAPPAFAILYDTCMMNSMGTRLHTVSYYPMTLIFSLNI